MESLICRACGQTFEDDRVPVCEVCQLCEDCHDHDLTIDSRTLRTLI